MSISLCFTPSFAKPSQTHRNFTIFKPLKPIDSPKSNLLPKQSLAIPIIKCASEDSLSLQPVRENPEKPGWENVLSALASLYPVYVTVGGIIACLKPSTFSWFVEKGPASYSLSLGFIMLAMGLTLELKDLINLFRQRPFSILYGCAAQYTIMPAFGWIISKSLGLPPVMSVGLILLACCPGGTASNVVSLIAIYPLCPVLQWLKIGGIRYMICFAVVSCFFQVTLIAQGDVPLSVVMTVCTTLGAVVLTPLLTKILAGAYVSVDAVKLSISTLQVVVAPILLGSSMQSIWPDAVKCITPFAPLLAVLASSLLACSVFSENVIHLKSSMVGASPSSDLPLLSPVHTILSSELGIVIVSVLMLHFAGFFVGYLSAAIGGFAEPQRRAMSIEVGMQNSSLGVVLATSHFSSPMIAFPPAMSAVIMNIMGSTLGFIWRYIDPSDSKKNVKLQDDCMVITSC
ncbi:probable sodium/metabolite cotransporter BASS2, chloroplastic isoform X1 [Coffea eugenioides]|uniref:Probable sodium/metabolite cotransporter BASS2, chloroplastic isoform X2 n=1 Tax=Coffea arabica TaxID=13443 RepID=A0ABM4WVY1_COFAR|nr:probable sodium/metabolite cotransporter BASS2, chloroplastic isoform X1 [Coffea eugenioides]